MPSETNTNTSAEAAPALDTSANPMPSPMQETPSSTVENLPQAEGDFATWLSDRLDKFEKGEETPPWEQKEEEPKAEAEPEKKEEEVKTEAEAEEKEEDKESEAEEEEDEESKNMSAAAGAKFKELKTELKTYKSKVVELEKAVEEAKATPQNSEEVEKMRSQLEAYEKEIALSRVEATPQYKKGVTEPTEAILESASTLAQRYKVDARKLVGALREESVAEGSDALTELASDFSERDRVRLYRMADDLSEISRRRDFLKENASRAMAEEQERVKAEESAMEKRYREETTRAAERVWADTFAENPVFSSLDKQIRDEIKAASTEADLLEASPDLRAYAVYTGVAFPHVVKQYEAAQAKVVELEKALSKYKKAAPKVSGNTDTTPTVIEEGGFLDAMEKRFSLG